MHFFFSDCDVLVMQISELAAFFKVLNPQKEILFIYRNDTWDLPKGMVEKEESIEATALREVAEECH